MNDIFKNKTPKYYIISQKFIKNSKKLNQKSKKIDIECSPRITSIFSKKAMNNNFILNEGYSCFLSENKKLNMELTNNSKKKDFWNKNSQLKMEFNDNNNIIQNENEYKNNLQQNIRKNQLEYNKLIKFKSEKLINKTTEIIQKKIRYHDLNVQLRKNSEKNYSPISGINNKKNEKNNGEKSSDESYITVYGVLFSKNNNIKKLKNRPGNLNMTNTNYIQNKLWKNNNNNFFPLSLPWLNKRNINNNILFNIKNNLSKTKLKTSTVSENNQDLSKIIKSNFQNQNLEINKNNKAKKLINYNMITNAGSDHGRIKVNQDCYFIIPKLDDCDEVKIFGIFDGHGDNGDKISTEIRDYFQEYFLNLFNKNNLNNEIKSEDNCKKLLFNQINNFKNISPLSCKNIKNIYFFRDKIESRTPNKNFKPKNLSFYFFDSKKNSESKRYFIKTKIKNEKIKNIYNRLSLDNYSSILTSYKKLDEILHKKYISNKFCYLSGSTSLILFLLNYKNCNKIISTNLGDSKIISISEKNQIKELNITHTPNNSEEKNRILKNGGVINRIDFTNIGPLRIWFKNKKYPGLSITRSFGDFESDDLGVISEPDIKEYDIDVEKIKIIVFGTDGIWKFLTNDKIMDIVLPYYEQNDANGAAKKISEIAIKLWNVKNPNGIADVTVFVLFFK